MMIPSVPYKPLYFLDDAKVFRRELKLPLVYVGGATSRSSLEALVDTHGFEFVQMGRALLREPGFVARVKEAVDSGSVEDVECGCDHVNYCIARMYSREMACHHCLREQLPPRIVREIEQIKARQKR